MMKKLFCLLFSVVPFTMVSCSDGLEETEVLDTDKVIVEEVSNNKATRSNLTNTDCLEYESLYSVRYKGDIWENVRLKASFANKLKSLTSLDVKHVTLEGCTDIEPNTSGKTGGKEYKCLYRKKDCVGYPIQPGYYICRNVFMVYKLKMNSENYIAKKEGSCSIGNMGFMPGRNGEYGFELQQDGDVLVCRTQGKLIISDLSGRQYNICVPTLRENLRFNIKYVEVEDF